jgi:hypothetical protein
MTDRSYVRERRGGALAREISQGMSSAGRPSVRRQFGAKSALDYVLGEKLLQFADDAKRHPEFAKELPRFLVAV